MTNILANSKIYKNFQTVIPKEVRKQYNVTDDTIIEWTKTDNVDNNIIYHGSNVEIPFPRILQNGFYKDFGYGFYCTTFKKQAKRGAMTKKGESIVNSYEYVLNSNLHILKFK